jgi:pyridoxine 4-dehydrogenase
MTGGTLTKPTKTSDWDGALLSVCGGYAASDTAQCNWRATSGRRGTANEALCVRRVAVDNGINHIDTAQYYGPGVVNELIHEALYPYPSDLAIVSKVAARRDDAGGVLAYDEPDQLRAGIEENLRTLGVDRLAAVNLRVMDHSPVGPRFDAQLAALIDAREEGLIDGIGLSNISSTHLERATRQTEIVCVQNLFNLADQRSFGILEECRKQSIAFVPFCPLGWPRGVQNAILTNPIVVNMGRRLGATPAQIALAWLLGISSNILLIPGTRTRTHLTENVGSGMFTLDEPIRSELTMQFASVAPQER